MKQNNKVLTGVVAVLLIGAGFAGGYMFEKWRSPARGQFGTFTVAGGQGQFAGRNGAISIRAGANGGFTAGEIISKDQNGVTIKMQDGSTKIILIGASAQISKQAAGSADDLAVGTSVTVTGAANSDGSITAQSVQIRPAGMGLSTTTRQQ